MHKLISLFPLTHVALPLFVGLGSCLATASANDLYVTNYNTSRIDRIATNADVTVFVSFPEVHTPSGLAFDIDGNLYSANIFPNSITKYTPDGSVSLFASLSPVYNKPIALAVDAAGNLYSTNYSTSTIYRFTPDGVESVFAVGGLLAGPTALAFDSAGDLYVGNLDDHTVIKITPAGVASYFASGLNQPVGLAFDSVGDLYVANLGGQAISKISPAGVVSQFVSTGGLYPAALAFDGAGDLFVVGSNPWQTPGTLYDYSVLRYTPAGVGSIFSANFGIDLPLGLAFAPSDSDGDGLTDAREALLGTNPFVVDTDDDGLDDGVEVLTYGCTDPLNPDTDGDTLCDGAETLAATNPCQADTDGDGLLDHIDPAPLVPATTSSAIENGLRALANYIRGLDLSLVSAPNDNAARGRRNALANKVDAAANAVANGDPALPLLDSVLKRMDGDASPPDWMLPSYEAGVISYAVVGIMGVLGT